MSTQLACTEKLLKEFKLRPTKLPRPDADVEPLSIWYAHLLYERQRKCLILINQATGYHLFKLFTKREEIISAGKWLPEEFKQTLSHDGFSDSAIQTALSQLVDLTICRTDSRSVLGHINDSLRAVDGFFDQFYRLDLFPIGYELAQRYNRGPCGPKLSFPVRNMATILEDPEWTFPDDDWYKPLHAHLFT